jgi:hypothetical protein
MVRTMSLGEFFRRWLSRGGSAAAIHKRGMAKAKREDWAGAITDYTLVIASASAPADLKGMAYINRALAFSHQGDSDEAESDLRAALTLPDTPDHIKATAKEKLARWEKRRNR